MKGGIYIIGCIAIMSIFAFFDDIHFTISWGFLSVVQTILYAIDELKKK